MCSEMILLLVDLRLIDGWQHMIDNMITRAHSQASGTKRTV